MTRPQNAVQNKPIPATIPIMELKEQPFAPTLARRLGDVPHVSGLLRRLAHSTGAAGRIGEWLLKAAVARGANHYHREFDPSLPPDSPAVTDEEIVQGIELLARTEGIFTETAGGVTIAVLKNLAAAGAIQADGVTVAYITGMGLKTQEAVANVLPPTVRIRPTLRAFEEAVLAHTA